MAAADVVKNATRVAAIILIEGGAAMHKRKLSDAELKLVGRALGWMVYATHGTDDDILKRLEKEIKSELPAASKTAAKSEALEDPVALEGRGRRRMRGGEMPSMIVLILGAIGSIFGINTVGSIYHTSEHRTVVREASLRQISAACPSDLALGPPPRPFLDFTGEYATALSQYETSNAQCEAAKKVGKARVDAAEAALKNAWNKIPAQAATIATAGSLVATGAVTGPAVAAAFTLGKSVHMIATSFVEGSVPLGGADFSVFVNTIADGFPAATAAPSASASAAPSAAAAAGEGAPAADAPAPSAAAAPARGRRGDAPAAPSTPARPPLAVWDAPPEGGRRRRKTRNGKPKRRVTRRKAPRAIKFVY